MHALEGRSGEADAVDAGYAAAAAIAALAHGIGEAEAGQAAWTGLAVAALEE